MHNPKKSKVLFQASLKTLVILAGWPTLSLAHDHVEELIVTGTRADDRQQSESFAPVEIFTSDELRHQADSDMAEVLSNLVPSYDVRATGDAASLVKPANLRGLPPDASLILVNGKRHHRSSVISFIGEGISDGGQGPDISTIPVSAIKKVEVLKDGASAQYGSDAMAGVINFLLNDSNSGGYIETKLGQSYHGDGDFYQIAGNLGLPLVRDGFINLSAEYRQADGTNRSVQRADAAQLIADGNDDVKDPAHPWGAPSVGSDFKSFVNLTVPLADGLDWYGFGNYAEREVDTGFAFRNPNTRSGVFARTLDLANAEPDANGSAIPFYVDANNNTISRDLIVDENDVIRSNLDDQGWIRRSDRLVADLSNDGSSGDCPQTDANNLGGLDVRDEAALALVESDPQCFVFNEWFPGGFTPRFGAEIIDRSFVTGLSGESASSAVTWDIYGSIGSHQSNFFLINSINASLGPESPTKFATGSYVQTERVLSGELTHAISAATPQHIAAGLQWHEEEFEVQAGEKAAWQVGRYASQGFSIGSNGFSGFNPNITGSWKRENIAAYIDYEANVTQDLSIGTAVRWEEFNSFGSTTNYKLSARWKINKLIAMRSTYSTGFRAPTPGQANITNITTAMGQNGLIDRGTIPPTSGIAQRFGGKELEPEKSKNFSLGWVASTADANFTVDLYQIELDNRITQSANISLSPEEAQALEDEGFSGASQLRSFRFYSNDFATQTRGVDLSSKIYFEALYGTNKVDLAYNYNTTDVKHFNPTTLNEVRIRQIEESQPKHIAKLSWTHHQGPFSTLSRINYYHGYWIAHVGEPSFNFKPSSKITLDLEASYSWGDQDRFTTSVGIKNLLNTFPDENPYGQYTGAKYPENAPSGDTGGVYYLRFRTEL